MTTHPTPTETIPCSTSLAALAEYGLPNGTTLVRHLHHDVLEDGFGAFEPTDAYLERVASTFRALFVELTGTYPVPLDIDAALDDARYAALDSLDGHVDADVRTEVLPTFYRQFAGYYCVYRGTPLAVDR